MSRGHPNFEGVERRPSGLDDVIQVAGPTCRLQRVTHFAPQTPIFGRPRKEPATGIPIPQQWVEMAGEYAAAERGAFAYVKAAHQLARAIDRGEVRKRKQVHPPGVEAQMGEVTDQ